LLDCGNTSGVARLKERGFFGVVFGAAGSGKSILGIQLCCSFVEGCPIQDTAQSTTALGRHAVYFTQEPTELIREKIVQDFKFPIGPGRIHMLDGDRLEKEKIRSLLVAWNSGMSSVTLVRVGLNPATQRAQLRNIFQLINTQFCLERREKPDDPDPKERLLVCVDNAETITPPNG
jgi:hypothetical protein